MQFYAYLVIERRLADDLPLGVFPTLAEAEAHLGDDPDPVTLDLYAAEDTTRIGIYAIVKMDRGKVIGGWVYSDERDESSDGVWERSSVFPNSDDDEPATIRIRPIRHQNSEPFTPPF